jgi:ABC-2 type transport system ATP-binding protein
MSHAVEIEGLTKVFRTGFFKQKSVLALDGLDLTVDRGVTFGFLGPNGAGKTTTLKLLMGLLRPTSGSARILGEPISAVGMHRRIGYLPEQAYFYDYLTARELLTYYGRLHDVEPRVLRPRVDELLERVGLEPAAFTRQLRKFSKGMLQRVGLAQAIVNDPEVVFLDEPMSGLDPIGRRQVRDLIASLRDDGKTIFFSSHILSDVEALCDRVAILNKGRLVETGPLSEILLRRSGELEIVATDLDSRAIEALRNEGFDVVVTPGGAHVRVAGEADVPAALDRIRAHGGRLISINPTRSSLEDFFMREIAAEEEEDARRQTSDVR